MKSKIVNLIDAETRLVVTGAWEEGGTRRLVREYRVSVMLDK